MKKAELAMDMIVMAALALVVLVVLLLFFTGKIGAVNKSLSDCQNQGGSCIDAEQCNSAYQGSIVNFTCSSGNVCCISLCAQRGGDCILEGQCTTDNQISLGNCGDGYVCCKQ